MIDELGENGYTFTTFSNSIYVKVFSMGKKHFFSILAGLLCLGCGASFREGLPVPTLKGDPKNIEAAHASEGAMVYLEDIRDNRKQTAFATYKDMVIQPVGDPVASIQTALKRNLESIGLEVTDSAALVLTGELRKWQVGINSGVPIDMQSEAVLYLEVYDPTNKRIYSGEYQGFAAIQKTSASNKDLNDALETAMIEVLAQIKNDKQLVSLLSSF